MRVNERSKIWSDLSAYLDGELTGREKAALEQRLQKDAQLRSELNQMKATRAMLRSLPRRKVPHDFSLTPEMAKAAQKNTWWPMFGYASLASALVAIVLLVVQILPGTMFTQGVLQAAKPEAGMAAESVMANDQAAASPEVIFWGGLQQYAPMIAAEGKGGAGGVGGGALDITAIQPYAQPEAPAAESAALPQATEAPVMGLMQEQPTASPEAEAFAKDSGSPTQESQPAELQAYAVQQQASGPILGVRPSEEANAITVPSTTEAETAPQAVVRRIPSYLAFIFLSLAAITGVFAFLFWRKR